MWRRYSETPVPDLPGQAPGLAEHTEEILLRLGFRFEDPSISSHNVLPTIPVDFRLVLHWLLVDVHFIQAPDSLIRRLKPRESFETKESFFVSSAGDVAGLVGEGVVDRAAARGRL